jgi:hypothetical protein
VVAAFTNDTRRRRLHRLAVRKRQAMGTRHGRDRPGGSAGQPYLLEPSLDLGTAHPCLDGWPSPFRHTAARADDALGAHRANDCRTLLVVQLWNSSGCLRSSPASLGLSRSSRLERDCVRDLAKKSGTLAGSGTFEHTVAEWEPFLLSLLRQAGTVPSHGAEPGPESALGVSLPADRLRRG